MLNLKIYNITPDYEKLEYSFLSMGPRGSILNVARFSVSRVKNIYQFEYGVINKDTGEIDDKIITNNKDTVLVINTICFILHDFLTHFEGTMVRFAGSTREEHVCLLCGYGIIGKRLIKILFYLGDWKTVFGKGLNLTGVTKLYY